MAINIWSGYHSKDSGYYNHTKEKDKPIHDKGKELVDIAYPHILHNNVHTHLTYRVNLTMGYVYRLDCYPIDSLHEKAMIQNLEHGGFKLVKTMKGYMKSFYFSVI